MHPHESVYTFVSITPIHTNETRQESARRVLQRRNILTTLPFKLTDHHFNMEPKNSANRMCSNTNPSISLLVFIRFRQTNYQKIALVALYKVMQTQHLCHPNPRITIAKSNAKISHLACAPIQILEYLPEYPLDWHEQNTKRKPSTRSTKTYQHHIHAIQTHVSALTMHPKNSAHLR